MLAAIQVGLVLIGLVLLIGGRVPLRRTRVAGLPARLAGGVLIAAPATIVALTGMITPLIVNQGYVPETGVPEGVAAVIAIQGTLAGGLLAKAIAVRSHRRLVTLTH
jgi:hypothetical protein